MWLLRPCRSFWRCRWLGKTIAFCSGFKLQSCISRNGSNSKQLLSELCCSMNEGEKSVSQVTFRCHSHISHTFGNTFGNKNCVLCSSADFMPQSTNMAEEIPLKLGTVQAAFLFASPQCPSHAPHAWLSTSPTVGTAQYKQMEDTYLQQFSATFISEKHGL